MDKFKWYLRGGTLFLFVLLMFYGYFIQERFKASKKPQSASFHTEHVDGFLFDKNLNAYKEFDDSGTILLDDPTMHKKTVYGKRGDLTLPRHLTIEDIRSRKQVVVDDFEVRGRSTRDRDDSNVVYPDRTYDGYIP